MKGSERGPEMEAESRSTLRQRELHPYLREALVEEYAKGDGNVVVCPSRWLSGICVGMESSRESPEKRFHKNVG